MRDDPYPARYYASVESDSTVTSTAADLPRDFTPMQRTALRLLFFLLVCYALLAILLFLTPSSIAAAVESTATYAPAWDCGVAKAVTF